MPVRIDELCTFFIPALWTTIRENKSPFNFILSSHVQTSMSANQKHLECGCTSSFADRTTQFQLLFGNNANEICDNSRWITLQKKKVAATRLAPTYILNQKDVGLNRRLNFGPRMSQPTFNHLTAFGCQLGSMIQRPTSNTLIHASTSTHMNTWKLPYEIIIICRRCAAPQRRFLQGLCLYDEKCYFPIVKNCITSNQIIIHINMQNEAQSN